MAVVWSIAKGPPGGGFEQGQATRSVQSDAQGRARVWMQLGKERGVYVCLSIFHATRAAAMSMSRTKATRIA